MENAPLCKFCGRPMEQNWCGMDKYYSCDCKGQKYKNKLEEEVKELKSLLFNKEMELQSFIDNSQYDTKIRNLKNEIQKLENQYRNSDN